MYGHGREQAYPGGRLDGAEELRGLAAGGRPDTDLIADALRAVLVEEGPVLRRANTLIGEITQLLDERMKAAGETERPSAGRPAPGRRSPS